MSIWLSTSRREAISDFCSDLEERHGVRAALRRARDMDDLLGIEAVDQFTRRLGGNPQQAEPDNLALAMLVAHRNVNRDGPMTGHHAASLAKRFGETSGNRRLLADLRFARLIHAADVPSRLRLLRRALGLLSEKKVSAHAVAEGWYQLNSPAGRRQFARAYFTADDDSTSTDSTPSVLEN